MAMNRQTIMNKPKDTKGVLRRVLSYIARYRAALVILLAFCLVSNVLALVGPGLAGAAISAAEAGPGKVDFPRVFYYAKWMLLCYLVSSVLTIVINILMTRISRQVAKKLRGDAFTKLRWERWRKRWR